MAEAKFILKEPNGNSNTLIYLFYNFDYKRLKYSTGEKINPKYWNPKKQRAKETKEFKEYPELNTRLDNIEAAVKSGYRKLKNDKQPLTSLNLRIELEIALEITKPTNKIDFISFIENYIEEMKSHKRPATITAYNTILKTLKQFSIEK